LACAAVGAFARATLVLAKARFARITIICHRSLGEVAALVRLDDHATTTSKGRDHDHDKRQPSHWPRP
jgi:hypothetical protein